MSPVGRMPSKHYGVLQVEQVKSEIESAREQMLRLGYALIDSGYPTERVAALATSFESTRKSYIDRWGEQFLRERDEHFSIRAMLLQGGNDFLELAFNERLHQLLESLLPGKYILNQQNGIVNPPQQGYNQGAWHRDLPYQHFVTSRPLAINALYCVDDFTLENGATYVVPASHLRETFPSMEYLERHAIQVPARAGHFIVLDCMLFHAGGFNGSSAVRRAVNHVFTIPLMKQQVSLAAAAEHFDLDSRQRELLGIPFVEPASVEAYISARPKRPR